VTNLHTFHVHARIGTAERRFTVMATDRDCAQAHVRGMFTPSTSVMFLGTVVA
jgi:hypothetical protein